VNIQAFGLTVGADGALQAIRKVTDAGVSMAQSGAKSAQLYADAFQEKLNRVARQYIPETMRAIDALRERQNTLARSTQAGGGLPGLISPQELQDASRRYDAMRANLEGVTETAKRSGMEMGRLRSSITTVAASALQSAPGVAQFGSVIGSLALGSAATVGIMAGLAAIGYAYQKITQDARDATAAQKDLLKEFDRIAHMDVRGQGAAASLLFSGDPNSSDAMTRQSVADLQRQRAELQRRAQASTMVGGRGGFARVLTDDAKEAIGPLQKVNAELERRNRLLLSVTGPGGSLGRAGLAQAAEDLPGQVTKDIEERKRAARDAAREAEAAAKRDHDLRLANLTVEIDTAVRKTRAKNDQEAAQVKANLAGVAAEVERVQKAYAAANPATDPKEKQYQDAMRQEWRRGLDAMLTGGLRSWSSFFDSVFGLFRRLMDRMEAAGKDSGALYGALKLGGAALSGGMAGFSVGQQVYSSSHGGFGNTARGALGGAAAGALAGSAFGPVGTAVGAVTGLIGGIIGIGSASKEAAKAMAEAVKNVTLSMDSLRATVKNDTLGQAIAAVEADRAARAKQIEDAWSGGGAGSDRVLWRTQQHKELNALEDERIRQLREEYAITQKRAYEDLQVRSLAAQGRSREAEALRLQLAQQREMEQYVKDKADPATIALLAQVQAQEKLAAATNRATTSALNFVEGYNIVAEAFRFSGNTTGMVGAGAGAWSGPSAPLAVPSGGQRGTPTPTAPIVIENIMQLDGREIARNSKKVYIDEASRSGDGDAYNWGRGL
jgi:hypothetical protein